MVTVTLQDDVITSVDVSGDPQKRESEEYQSRFIGGIADVVVGQDIDQISVSRVAGSSLTSGGFNQAIDDDQVRSGLTLARACFLRSRHLAIRRDRHRLADRDGRAAG